MTLPEFISWQAYAKAKRDAQAKPAPPELPELGALGPAGVAAALR